MQIELQTIVGIAASIGTSISQLPQLIKLIKHKKAKDVSLVMLGVLIVGVGLWIWYGIIKNDWIIIISNSFALLVDLATFIFGMKYQNSEHPNQQ